ncbi:MAG: dTMP kinase [Coprothermobacterota bacterium]|nr:dTMP kinase [Coprothermobacterota bacterium]
MKGLFITLEGIDGSGKSTQAQFLAERLRSMEFPVLVSHEPGGSSIGLQIRAVLLARENIAMCAMTEMLLYAADRAQHVQEVIRPALDQGQVVIVTRYNDSTMAYQSWGHGLSLQETERVCTIATGGLWPHLTVVLDLEPQTGLKRTQGDRLEAEGVALQAKVREAYMALATHYPERIRIVSAQGEPQEVFERVWHWVLHLLEKNPLMIKARRIKE